MSDLLQKIYDYSLEDIMGERFGSYSKYVIQDRAIPDVRDGLKPVQRRILYAMYKEKNTHDKPFRKCAKTVGVVIGNYHPHGDTSVYDAMVRMSQSWKQRTPYVEIHGNNGSIDGDSAAAMRYTEGRLAKISNELLKDIEKDCVTLAPNFDDTILEPTVLPAKFPNLLVNGATGISAGYATNIPPHNLGELIDATILLIRNPNASLDDVMEIVKGPDFPTGGFALGIEGIKTAFETGRGKVIVKSKIEVIKKQIVITEIPYEVNKANLVRKMDEIRIDKKVDGISEVRDESSREGLRIVIDTKTGANIELIINYLLKNTDLQVNYNYNMISIVNRRPKLLGIIPILKAYIAHQKEVITLRTQFELDHAKVRLHIVEGLIKALSILDEVIKTIRASKNKSDAIDNLVNHFDFTIEQATAIVMLQLYKLTNTDVTELEDELASLIKKIKIWQSILASETILKEVMIKELGIVKEHYPSPRLTEIVADVEEIKIDTAALITKENAIVVVTNDGYVKRVSERSYSSSDASGLKEGDYITGLYKLNTLNTVLLFTNLGNYLFMPVHQIPETKYKDLGTHASNIITLKPKEVIIGSIPVNDFNNQINVVTYTQNGMIKKTSLDSFLVQRYSKPINVMKLKGEDEMIGVFVEAQNKLMVVTEKGYGLVYQTLEVPVTGLKSSGVKSINLKNDIVVKTINFGQADYIIIFTDKSTGKRIKLSEFNLLSRAKRGVQLIREVKTNPHKIINAFITDQKEFQFMHGTYVKKVKMTELPITDRYSTGSTITKMVMDKIFIDAPLNDEPFIVKESAEKEPVTKESLEARLMTIDDFLDNI